ncbi:MAG: helix-turn-helix domain-containing protein [Bacteroidaceae bacterium]|nr:helix-turn-helix domain-containing protein [Bacteroidaceae bacterium]
MSGTQKILKHLQRYHKITALKAWNSYGVYRLADVIYKLRQKGYDIETNMVYVKNKFGDKVQVAEYTLW